ncbi:MAG TPA: hypothetical protein ENN18_04650 [Proteobacteria bacterium]|nr:hypothetical protein [Pseudomonadota bacterium]
MNHILVKTFENEFREGNYKDLVVNLFNRFDFSKEYSLKQYFTEDEKQKIKDLTYLGTFEDTEKKSLDVLIVELKGGSKVERARSLQRNLIGKYLKGNLKDSALVAFYSKDNPDWRLSFVKMDYKIGDRGVKVEIGIPPKRYSFLVGKYEPSYTAKKQLQPIISPDVTPTVLDVEKAFSIEKVTKEFYNRIAEMFTKLVGGERKIGSRKIAETGSLKLPSTTDDTVKKEFAVRLIGRLLFCWFLKKKKSDNDIPLIPPAILSSNAIEMYPNYYHRLLEPLFFQVLNTPVERRDKRVGNDPWLKIPFLNGGLFEPHQYDFYDIDVLGTSKFLNTLKVPDEWFTELFRIFEEYNFTIDESSTIDIEISVDPEMLGRIFENLLAEINPETGETARKSTGSYYTPRPIVEYMVDESLKQYLLSQIPTLAKGGEGGFLDEDKLSRLLSYGDWEIELTETEKDSIIDALDRVKIIDPACGSGAFPMGILHKMLLILQKIDPESKKWLSKKLPKIDNKLLRHEVEAELKKKNWDYIHKLGIIQYSIYGVDIQPIAVEISKLRFFLSLIVDEKVDDSKPDRGIVPLPNLEFKFVAANSLIGLPKLWDQSKQGKYEQKTMFESHDDIEKLRELRDAYFTAYGNEKRRIEKEFKETQDRMFMHALNWKATGSQTYKLSEWNPFEDEASSWFDPEWMFGVTGGFDITIGNPPYVRADAGEEHLALRRRIIESKRYETLWEKWDLFIPFIELGYKLLRENGISTMIVSDAYCHSKYAQKSQNWFLQNSWILRLDFLSKIKVFEAGVHNLVYFFQKRDGTRNKPERRVHEDEFGKITFLPTDEQHRLSYRAFFPEETKDDVHGIPLERICYITYGLRPSSDEHEAKGEFVTADLVSQNSDSIHCKPYVEGKHLDNWYRVKHLWLEWGTERAPSRFCRPTFPELYSIKEKLLAQRSPGPDPVACYDDEKLVFTPACVGFIPWHSLTKVRNNSLKKVARYKDEKPPRPDLPRREELEKTSRQFSVKYLLAVMNSSVAREFLRAHRRSNIHLYPDDWKKLPVPDVPMEKQTPIVKLVDQILAVKQKYLQADISALERQIDKIVYELYGLTPEEVEIVEGKG